LQEILNILKLNFKAPQLYKRKNQLFW